MVRPHGGFHIVLPVIHYCVPITQTGLNYVSVRQGSYFSTVFRKVPVLSVIVKHSLSPYNHTKSVTMYIQ